VLTDFERRSECAGAKYCTEAASFHFIVEAVGEHSDRAEVTSRGVVDWSEETLPALVARRQVRTLSAENPRLPEQGQSAQG
jgi:hypothetical protein